MKKQHIFLYFPLFGIKAGLLCMMIVTFSLHIHAQEMLKIPNAYCSKRKP